MKYTREIAEEVLRDWNQFDGHSIPAFLESKFPKLHKTGLLVSKRGSLIFRTGKTRGYGFDIEDFFCVGHWSFIDSPYDWKPATPKDYARFKTLVLKELKSRGIGEGTKFESLVHSNSIYTFIDKDLNVHTDGISIGSSCVYYKDKWIKPIKKDILKDVVSALESGLKEGYIIEKQKDGVVTIKSL